MSPVAPRATTPDRSGPSLTPVLPAGQSDLVGGVTAVRGDTDVVVAFDTPETRTRRPEKFEQFVRTTLPLVYGSAMRNVLARIRTGRSPDRASCSPSSRSVACGFRSTAHGRFVSSPKPPGAGWAARHPLSRHGGSNDDRIAGGPVPSPRDWRANRRSSRDQLFLQFHVRQSFDQRTTVGVDDERRALRSTHEALVARVVEEADERRVVVVARSARRTVSCAGRVAPTSRSRIAPRACRGRRAARRTRRRAGPSSLFARASFRRCAARSSRDGRSRGRSSAPGMTPTTWPPAASTASANTPMSPTLAPP